jgi:hypothetical protein
MFDNLTLPVESKLKKSQYPNSTIVDVMCAAIEVHNYQGFIRSGQGYTDHNHETGESTVIRDNKTVIAEEYLSTGAKFTQEQLTAANVLIDSINGKLMIKKMTNSLNNFEQNVAKCLNEADVSKFGISIIASLPHSVNIDKKREEVEDKMSTLKHSSIYFGDKGKRYNVTVDVLDVKFIQSSSVYMITTVYAKKDIIKFWWRDQPDLVDIIADKVIKIRGTVKNQEVSKYSDSKETMLNRVKILAI